APAGGYHLSPRWRCPPPPFQPFQGRVEATDPGYAGSSGRSFETPLSGFMGEDAIAHLFGQGSLAFNPARDFERRDDEDRSEAEIDRSYGFGNDRQAGNYFRTQAF